MNSCFRRHEKTTLWFLIFPFYHSRDSLSRWIFFSSPWQTYWYCTLSECSLFQTFFFLLFFGFLKFRYFFSNSFRTIFWCNSVPESEHRNPPMTLKNTAKHLEATCDRHLLVDFNISAQIQSYRFKISSSWQESVISANAYRCEVVVCDAKVQYKKLKNFEQFLFFCLFDFIKC
jgi:hypothetical protein